MIDSRINKQEIDLKKKQIVKIISERFYEAKRKNLKASLQYL